jgi:adenylate cyclase
MFARRQSRQRAVIAAIVAVSIAVGSILVFRDAFGPNLQAAVYDFAITQYPAAVRNQVAIVGVDDKTITKYGRYPLPRQAYTDLLRVLKGTRARVVAFDIGFYDESPDPAADRSLAAAIKDSGNVILAMQGSGSFSAAEGAERFGVLSLPIPIFRDAAVGLGSVNVDPDSDGRVRAAQLVVEGPKGEQYYALPLVAATRSLLAAQQVAGDTSAIKRQGEQVVLPGRAPLPDRVMPIDRSGAMAVYFVSHPSQDLSERTGPPCSTPDEFCVVSLADVVDGKVPLTFFNERAVLVGFHSASAIPDNYPTPNSAGTKMWGVEIWANTMQSIFTNRYPVRHQGPFTTIVLLSAASIVGALLVARFRLFGFLASLGSSGTWSPRCSCSV